MAEQTVNASQKQNNLTLKHRLGYGAGDMGGVITLIMVSSYMTRYITNILQVPYATLSILLLIWNIWDMVNDPLMGTLMDKAFAKSEGGRNKFRPWILWSIPLIVLGLIAFYSVPTTLGGMTTVILLFFLKIVYELGYTMMNIAMGSLLGVMAMNDVERTTLASARGMGSTLGMFISMFTIPQILGRLGETPRGYMVAAIVMAILGGIIIFIHYAWTEERALQVADDPTEEDPEASNVKFTDIIDVFKNNRAFLALCLHSIIFVFGQQLNGTTAAYMYADVFDNFGLMSYASTIQTVLSVVILLLAPQLVKIFGSTDKLIRICLIVGVVLLGGLYFLLQTGTVTAVMYLILSALGLGMANMAIQLQWGLVSESIDYNEYISGKRTEGAIYGTFSLTRRLGQTFSQSLAVLIIGWIGYNPELTNQGLSQSAGTIAGLQVVNILIPAIAYLLSWASFRFIWNIDNEKRAEISAWKYGSADQSDVDALND
ncbi:MFS transporter [Aerococcaceae bacterium DSM 111020]|nr:MFS transporter [Aerococcaceae bacterium DSM 111020]